MLGNEAEQRQFIEAIERSHVRMISSSSFLEPSIVILQRYGEEGSRDSNLYIAKVKIEVKPVDFEQVQVVRRAYLKFGNSRHPANSNFGDCFAYALSKRISQPSQFKGDEFSKLISTFIWQGEYRINSA